MANQYTPWTKEEEDTAMRLRARGRTFEQVANELRKGGRNVSEAGVKYHFQHVLNVSSCSYKCVAISDKAIAALYEPHGGAVAYRGR